MKPEQGQEKDENKVSENELSLLRHIIGYLGCGDCSFGDFDTIDHECLTCTEYGLDKKIVSWHKDIVNNRLREHCRKQSIEEFMGEIGKTRKPTVYSPSEKVTDAHLITEGYNRAICDIKAIAERLIKGER